MARVAFDAQDLCDNLKFLASLALNLKTDTAADIRKPSRQMNKGSRRANILCSTFSHNVSTLRIIPFGSHFQSYEITRAGAIVTVDLAKHSWGSRKKDNQTQ